MKTLFTIAALLISFTVQSQTTTRCYKNADGSITCVTTRGGAGF